MVFNELFKACERSCDIEIENLTSEFETSQIHNIAIRETNLSLEPIKPIRKKDQEPRQQTLYEFLECAKTKSILKNSKYGPYHVRLPSNVQFNESGTSNRVRSNRVPIRISSVKRESKTGQTLSIVVRYKTYIKDRSKSSKYIFYYYRLAFLFYAGFRFLFVI